MKNIHKTAAETKTKRALLTEFMRGSLHLFIVSIISSLVVAAVDMLNPQILRYTIDSVIGNNADILPDAVREAVGNIGGISFLRDNLWICATIIAVFALVSAVFRYLQRLYNTKASETLVEHIRNTLFDHISHLPFAWHMKHSTGDIIQRCTSDIDMVKRFLSEQLTSIVRIVITVVLSLVFMFSMNTKMAVAAAVTMPSILIYSAIFGRKVGAHFKECDEAEGVLSAVAQENLTGVRVVRAFGKEKFEREKFRTQNNIYNELCRKLSKLMSAFWGIGDLISGLQILLIISLGSYLAAKGELIEGEFIAFVSYNAMLSWPLRHLGRMISELSKAGISFGRLSDIMNADIEHDKPDAVTPDLSKEIVFDDVSFGYEGTPELLHHISFTVAPGETVGILGGTGSGKSTLMHLLDRLYNIPEGCGKITIGGVDISDIRAGYLRKNIGMVLQEPFLFSRSIADNISIVSDGMSLDEVRSYARIACLDDTVATFSEGYDTFVGERGVTLSGGQKQRAAIARMLTMKAPIMVFDDSLSAVDTETDAKIRSALSGSLSDSTVFLVSHRTSTLMHADKIIVLDAGSIAEMGTHDELMAIENGIYRRIFDIQMSFGEEFSDSEPSDKGGDDCNE